MKYTKEQLQEMSDFEVNKALAAMLGALKEPPAGHVTEVNEDALCYRGGIDGNYFRLHERYCSDVESIMPLAFEHKISLVFNCVYCEPVMWEAVKGAHLGIHDGDFLYDMVYPDTSPLRAIACCLILVLQERDK